MRAAMPRDSVRFGRLHLELRARRMSRNTYIFSFLLVTLVALDGCSSSPSANEAKKAAVPIDRIQGKVDVVIDPPGTGDGALNAGGPSLYLWEGKKRYRLYSRKALELVGGNEYIVEGINAQKVIDDIGDPAQGKGGYPLAASCERVVKMAWKSLPFDEVDVKVSVLRNKIARYPARTVFLVTKVEAVPADAKKSEPEEKELPTVAVPAAKQKASLIAGPTVQTAPLWDPTGATVSCKVIINGEGKISELETGAQLCEYVQWSQFSFKPLVQGGHPVNVKTEVEVRFDPRK